MRPREDIAEAVRLHGDAAWHVCVLYFKRSDEAQDAWQETFLKYAQADGMSFNDEEHRKAWLIRVAANVCKDMLKAAHRRDVALDEATFDEGGFNRKASRKGHDEGESPCTSGEGTGGSRATARDSVEAGSVDGADAGSQTALGALTEDSSAGAFTNAASVSAAEDVLSVAPTGAFSARHPLAASAQNQPGSATGEVLDAMRALDDPPRTPLYLALYLGYTAPEIASMTNAPVNTVYSWITRGKKQLREALR